MTPLNRREFVRVAGAAGIAALGAPLTGAETPSLANPTRKLRKGFFMGAYPGKASGTSWMEKFQAVRAAGFEGVEVPSHLDRDELLRARDATGLEIVGVACGPYTRMTSQPDPAKRKLGTDGLIVGLHDAKAYGASTVLCVPGGINASISYADAYRRTHEAIAPAIPVARELGLKIASENVTNRFLVSPLECARYVDEFQSPDVGWQFDVGNCTYIGWADQWIQVLGSRILKVHIKEFSRQKMNGENLSSGFAVEYLEGDVDWPAVMRALDRAGYQGWCIAEPGYHPPGVAAPERLKQVYGKLSRILEAGNSVPGAGEKRDGGARVHELTL